MKPCGGLRIVHQKLQSSLINRHFRDLAAHAATMRSFLLISFISFISSTSALLSQPECAALANVTASCVQAAYSNSSGSGGPSNPVRQLCCTNMTSYVSNCGPDLTALYGRGLDLPFSRSDILANEVAGRCPGELPRVFIFGIEYYA